MGVPIPIDEFFFRFLITSVIEMYGKKNSNDTAVFVKSIPA